MAAVADSYLNATTSITSDPAAIPYTSGLNGVNQVANNGDSSAMLYSLVGFGVCLVVIRWARIANVQLRKVVASTATAQQQKFWTYNHSWWWPFIKKNVLYAPLLRSRRNREFKLFKEINMGVLPTRFQVILIFLYALSNVVYCAILTPHQDRNATIAELRGRAGVLAVYNLIPTILFAMRNNPLIQLLHVSFDTFNLFHRWMARIVIVESCVHTLAWTVNNLEAGGYEFLRDDLNTSTSFKWGLVGTVLLTTMFWQAWSPVRHAFYETFLNIHKLLALFAFIGIYVHLDKAKLPQLPYFQCVFIIWGAEYFFRLFRICWYNIGRRPGCTTVTVEALPAEACRVTFHLARPWKFRPGSHVHAYIPRLSLWSSHPFSVAWAHDISPSDLSEKDLATPSTLEFDPKSLRHSSPPANPLRTDVSLVMRCMTGMTRALYRRASAAPSKTLTLTGFLEGPYAGHDSLDSYGTVLLFAAGVGITHQLGYVRHLLAGHASGTVAARKVVLIWSVQTLESLEWVRPWMDDILAMPGRREVLRVLMFVTRPRSAAEVVSGSGSVRLVAGRCNPRTLVDREVEDRVGAMAVTVCGPGAFSDAVREAVRRRVGVGSVDFVEEAFTY